MLPSTGRAESLLFAGIFFLNLCWQPCRKVTKDYKSVGCILNLPAMPCLTDHTHLPLKLLTLRCSAPINEAQRCMPAMCVCVCVICLPSLLLIALPAYAATRCPCLDRSRCSSLPVASPDEKRIKCVQESSSSSPCEKDHKNRIIAV